MVRRFRDKGDWKWFGAGGELWLCTGVLLKEEQKSGGFRSKLNTEFLKHRLWFFATPYADLGILLCLKACKVRYVAAAHSIYIYGIAAAFLFVSGIITVWRTIWTN